MGMCMARTGITITDETSVPLVGKASALRDIAAG
jgi:hypothetical protein